ncbi:unnamed protein product [Discula destructiva]
MTKTSKTRALRGVQEDDGAYFLDGTYLDDLDNDDGERDGHLDGTHGCLPRFRVWTAGLLHPRRHSSRVLSWAGFDDFRYNPLY